MISVSAADKKGEPSEATVYAENPKYMTGTRAVYVTIYGDNAYKTGGHIYKPSFKSLTGKDAKDVVYDGKNIIIDKTPITIGK